MKAPALAAVPLPLLLACAPLFFLAWIAPSCHAANSGPVKWPLWESYCGRFLDEEQGRMLDKDDGYRTTSEAQAYALFFALVANDRARFDRMLAWTADNLAGGDLTARLPAWTWGRSKQGKWGVLDENAASDADLWLAYTLLEAGRLWREPRFTQTGSRLAGRIAAEETAEAPGLGTVLLPGPKGFRTNGAYVLNSSYMPVQALLGLHQHAPGGPWKKIAASVPRLLKEGAVDGLALDWVAFHENRGFAQSPLPAPAAASYDAIRVYLWAGLLHPGTPLRKSVLDALAGMREFVRLRGAPPAVVTGDGKIKDPNGGVGFSAALVPYLGAVGDGLGQAAQKRRVESELNRATGLYGRLGLYYDQNLVLFSTGWSERRYSFDAQGRLNVSWRAR